MIIRKELTSGQRLSEIGLSERLGVSRTPVHDALRRLSNDGFVLIVPKSGAWVASPSWREVENAYAVRCKLETWAAGIAVHNVTPLFLARLNERILTEDEIFKTRDLENYLEVNTAFHKIIAEASGNSLLEEYIGDVLSKTFIYMVFMERFFDFENNPSLDEHRSILEAYSSRDESMCVCLIERHIMNTLDGLRR
ncbi:MAG: GntR family transcriptional regulator [Synergistaceae bacterium]|jgi:DNA-binding GntR family transcriptional regulator|nr:GntR family transcriptional regulator [Synergistaceae bacterium]